MRRIINFLKYDVPSGIKNLISWFPVIWKDRDWDDSFIFIIIRKKLIRVEKLLRHNSHYIGAEQDADDVKVCILLLTRIIDDEYFNNYMIPFEKKWGKNSWDIFNKDYKENPDRTKDFSKVTEQENHSKQQDIEYLFKLLTKHIQSWWD